MANFNNNLNSQFIAVQNSQPQGSYAQHNQNLPQNYNHLATSYTDQTQQHYISPTQNISSQNIPQSRIPLCQPKPFHMPPDQGRYYQANPMTFGMQSPYNPFAQNTQYPFSYNVQPTHMPPPLYHQTPYLPTPIPYHNTPINQYPAPQNNHNVTLPDIPFTKYTKVEFSKFNSDDLRIWLYKVEQFFAEEDISIQQKMKLVSLHFEGDALQWHLGYMRSRGQMPLPNWEEYLWALTNSFGLNILML